MLETDLLFFDPERAEALARSMSVAANDLFLDHFSVGRLLDQATEVLAFDARRIGRGDPDLYLQCAARELEELARDLHLRLASVRRLQDDIALLDAFTIQMRGWRGPRQDPTIMAAREERFALLVSLLGGDLLAAGLVSSGLDQGLSYAEALDAARAAMILDARIDGLVAAFGISSSDARDQVAQLDADRLRLQELGFGLAESEVAVSLALHYSADLDDAIAYSQSANATLVDSMGSVIAGQGLGISAAEFDALMGLRDGSPQLDRLAGSGISNGKVSISELEYIVENECRFSDGQVGAAAALLATPELIYRLDTAAENDEILGPDRFGATQPGDGVISLEDVEAFMYKAQFTHVLAPYADEIDVAADPSSVVDGIHSRNDLEAFLAVADTNGTPTSATAALTAALDNGWFDENWFQEHREEVAYAAAMVAGGTVVLLSGGTATPLVLVMAGAAGGVAAGGTILAVNSVTENQLADGLLHGVAAGIVIGVGSASVVGGIGNTGKLQGVDKAIAAAGIVSDTTGIVAAGATDILMPEVLEGQVKGAAGAVNDILVPVVAINTEQLRDVAGPLASEIVFEE
jgi:hypothetical protein